MSRYTSRLYTHIDDVDEIEIKKMKDVVKQDDIYYPQLHIAPKCGLLNDPNGLAFFNGYYYVFHQYHPNNIDHGMKYWYLYKTKDFINYKDIGIFIKPEFAFNNFGIYSGGAKVIGEELYLFYTGNRRNVELDFRREPQQCVLVIDKNDKVIRHEVIIPFDENLNTEHFRDPIPFTIDGRNFLMIGKQNHQQIGKIQCYEFDERYTKILKNAEMEFNVGFGNAYMLECPSIIMQNESSALVVSPQGLESIDKFNFQNIFDVVYLIGDTNALLDMKFNDSALQQMDYGFDFYAPQTFYDGKDNVLIGWLGQAETIYPCDEKNMWSQMLTIPRKVRIENTRLFQEPHHFINELRGEYVKLASETEIKNKCFDFNVVIEKNGSVKFNHEDNYICISYHDELVIDRGNDYYLVNEEFGLRRYIPISGELVKIRIIVDNSSMELFINDGEYVATMRYFLPIINNISMKNASGFLYYLNSIQF